MKMKIDDLDYNKTSSANIYSLCEQIHLQSNPIHLTLLSLSLCGLTEVISHSHLTKHYVSS